MDIIKAYAEQVASFHPPGVRKELASEIYANLSEECDDWQSENEGAGPGDFLDQTKVHPMKYATQFAEAGTNYLVGPQFYFSFISAIKTAASIIFGVYFILAIMLSLTTGSYTSSFIGIIAGIPGTLLWVSAIILGIFVAIERSGESASWLDKWSSTDLRPQLEKARISRAETFFDMGISILGLLLVLGIIDLPLLVRHDGDWIDQYSWFVQLPAWMWWAAGALLVFDIGFSALRLLRSYWTTPLRLITIATNLLWIALIVIAASYPQLITLVEPSRADFSDVLPLLNKGATILLLSIGAVIGVDTLVHVWRLLKQR